MKNYVNSLLNKKTFIFLSFCLSMIVFFGTDAKIAAADQAPTGTSDVYNLIVSGIDAYQNEQYSDARDSFEDVIALSPNWEVLIEVRRRLELGRLTEIVTDVALRERPEEAGAASEAASTVLSMMTEAHRMRKMDVTNLDKVMDDFISEEHEKYMNARITFIEHNMYSVSYLLELLAQTDAEKKLLIARTVTTLRDIRRSAALPLIAAMQTEDELLLTRIISALAHVGRRDALAPLLAVTEDQGLDDSTREAAWESIQDIQVQLRVPVELESAIDEYVNLTRLYLTEDKSEIGHVVSRYVPVWWWDARGEKIRHKLNIEFVPNFVYYQIQGTQTAMQGLALYPDHSELQSLLLAAMSREYAHLKRYKEKGSVEEFVDYAGKRLNIIAPVFNRTAHLFGPTPMAHALMEVLEIEDDEAAVYLINSLAGKKMVSGPVINTLCLALESENPQVRFDSALVLIKVAPELPDEFCSADKVIAVIRKAIKYSDEVPEIPGHKEIVKSTLNALINVIDRLDNYPVWKLEPEFSEAVEKYDGDEDLKSKIVTVLGAEGSSSAFPILIDIVSNETLSPQLRYQALDAFLDVAQRLGSEKYGLNSNIIASLAAVGIIDNGDPYHFYTSEIIFPELRYKAFDQALRAQREDIYGKYREDAIAAALSALSNEDEALHSKAGETLNFLGLSAENIIALTEDEMKTTKILSREELLGFEIDMETVDIQKPLEDVEVTDEDVEEPDDLEDDDTDEDDDVDDNGGFVF